MAQADVESDCRVILTGAGTSDYIGQTLWPSLAAKLGWHVDVLPATQIVCNPESCLRRGERLLVISFARSGNSPESLAAVELAERFSPECQHLVITCNREGKLAQAARERGYRALLLTLDPETNDKGLAMTSSFTSMYIAGLGLIYLNEIDLYRTLVSKMVTFGTRILNQFPNPLFKLAQLDFDRVVFLGDGPLLGIAAESHLKLQELTNGLIATFYHDFLAFRHGPAAIIHPRTVVVYLLSNHPYRRTYEFDLIREIRHRHIGLRHVLLCGREEMFLKDLADEIYMVNENNERPLEDAQLAPLYIIFAQILGVFCALKLGIKPDFPNPQGTINRVVQGVTIYSWQG